VWSDTKQNTEAAFAEKVLRSVAALIGVRGAQPAGGAGGRGLHSSTFRLNVSAYCETGGAYRGCQGH